MMKWSFKKRIAIFNTLAVAITTATVFVIIYIVVHLSSYRHLDNDILLEKEEVLNTLDWKGDAIIINKMPEWEEAEHKKVEVNPTFIQIVDNKDQMIFKTANLKSNHFLFNPGIEKGYFYNSLIDEQRLRLGQFPVKNDNGIIIGQLTIGISQQESYYVLNNLLLTLCISYPLMLLILYWAIYIAASKAIAPVHKLIHAASSINDTNIQSRLPLPENEDELYRLAATINELLGRIERSVQQQKQFTADASHEIRTPLTAIRGTLEVLIRKKREPEQYEEKIREVIIQSERLNILLDQLLQLARLDSGTVKKETVYLNTLLHNAELKFAKQVQEKKMQVIFSIPDSIVISADPFFLSIIIDNLISNAIKYGSEKSIITFDWNPATNTLSITNNGPEITKVQIPQIFDRFYRTDDSRSSHIPGSGLGLAIVKKLSDLQQINVSVKSSPGSTTFLLHFAS